MGAIYYWSFSVVFASATGLAVLHWATDAYLFAIGAIAFGCASAGYAVREFHLEMRIGVRSAHAADVDGMGLSYIALLTAFYVDNGPHLPLLRQLPTLAFWLLPSLIGLPVVVRALVRYTQYSSRNGNAGAMAHRVMPLSPMVPDKPDARHSR